MQLKSPSLKTVLLFISIIGSGLAPIESRAKEQDSPEAQAILAQVEYENSDEEPGVDANLDLEIRDETNLLPADSTSQATIPGPSWIPPNATIVTEDTQIPDEFLVEVEPTSIIPVDLIGDFYLVPYRLRRSKWGSHYGISYGTFDPQEYEPNNVLGSFGDVYTSAETGLLEFHLVVKRNYEWGSLGIDFGAGSYQNKSDTDLIAANLKVSPVRLGGTVILDCFWQEPYFAPYLAGGIYTIFYNETSNSTSFNGNTQVSYYATVGALIQMDAVDRLAARDAYQDSGIENTFLFVEGRMFVKSGAEEDPDFSGIHANAGIKIEL